MKMFLAILLKRRHLKCKVQFKTVFTRVNHFWLILITNLMQHNIARKKRVVYLLVTFLFHGKD